MTFGKPLVAAALTAFLSAPSLAVAGAKTFMVVLNGAQETPPNGSGGTGNGILTYDDATKTLCYSISFTPSLLGSAEILAHIHGPGAPGTPAAIIMPLPLGNPKQACVVDPGAPFLKKDLLKNLYYVNIHTAGLPGGELRGQILRIK